MEALFEKFTKSPLASSGSFGIILIGLEKLLALQFACPCDGLRENIKHTAWWVIIPTMMTFAMMLLVRGFECNLWSVISITSPSVVWLMLMFLDGRYFTCAKTGWKGRYVKLDGADPQRWCKPNNSSFICPDNENLEPLQGCMLQSQKFFVTSQRIGFVFLFYMGVLLVLHLVRPVLCTICRETNPPQDNEHLLCRTDMKKKNINLEDVYDFVLRKSGNNLTPDADTSNQNTTPSSAAGDDSAQPVDSNSDQNPKKHFLTNILTSCCCCRKQPGNSAGNNPALDDPVLDEELIERQPGSHTSP